MNKYFFLLATTGYCLHATAQNVGIGLNNPNYKLTVSSSLVQPNNNTHVLSLRGRNPVLSFSNENDVSYGYIKMWSNAPFAPYTNGLVVGANPGYPLFFSTNNYGVTMTLADNGNAGIGTTTPDYKLTVASNVAEANTNTHLLKLKGQNPVLLFADQDENSYGYIKMWSFQPFVPFTNGLVIGSNPGYPIFLSTNYAATMTIASNGNVGINTTTPATRLHVNKDAEAFRLSGSGTYMSFYNGNNYKGYLWSKDPNDIELGTATENTTGNLNLRAHGVDGLTVLNDGRVKVGALPCTLSAQGDIPKFSVFGPIGLRKNYSDQSGEWAMRYGNPTVDNPNGLVFVYNGGLFKAFIDEFDGSWRASSDARLKENFKDYKNVLEGINKLNVLTFQYKSDNTKHTCFGLVAQNLKQYFPELVSGDEKKANEYMAIAYDKTGVLAIKAIQEQQQIIEQQQTKIDALEKRLAALELKKP